MALAHPRRTAAIFYQGFSGIYRQAVPAGPRRPFGSQRSDTEVHALADVNFEVEKGAFISITGPSGSGKSTLLNMLGLLDRPSSGHVYIDGNDYCCVSSAERTRVRREQIGFVFQSFNLIPTLTALENVMLPMRYARHPDKRGAASRSLEHMGLEHRAGFRSNELSGGEQQRVAIARALVMKPAIVLADEPTGELDSKNSDAIISLLLRLNREEGHTIIIVTHDLGVAARTDFTMNMVDGRIEA